MINVAELDERIDRCLGILADNPHSQVFAALAEAYRRRGDFGRAFSVCKSGLKHHPDYGPAHIVLAKLFLHQKMLPDALSSLRRAVDLDGSTRVTDHLEAETQLALGNADAAQIIIDRLRVTDSGNPALPELIGELKRLRSGPPPPPAAVVPDDASRYQPRPAPEPRADSGCIDWPAWVRTLGSVQGVDVAFVFDAHGRVNSGYPESDAARMKIDSVVRMVQEVTAQLPGKSWGALCELRIEAGQGDVWVKHWGDVTIGLKGLPGLSVGAARQRGLDLAGRIQVQPSSPRPAGVPEL